MMNVEEIKRSVLLEHRIELAEENFAKQKAVFENVTKLDQETNEKLDMGVKYVDLIIEFKNRLWLMEKNQVDKDDPEYIALDVTVRSYDKHYAEVFYESQGWYKKYSGEWVREK